VLVRLLKNGYRLFNRYPFFLCLLYFSSYSPVLSAADLTPVNSLTEVSVDNIQQTADFSMLDFATPELSVRLMDQFQPAMDAKAKTWFEWEQKRLQLLSDLQQWSEIIGRINQYQSSLPADFQPWFILNKASAQLKNSETVQVRDDLRQLIWSEYDLTTEQIAQARRLIIRSYLAEKKSHDAQRAMLRYRQDYGDSDVQWKRLQARVLLATGRYQQAVDLLANETDKSLMAIKALTRLHAGLDAATSVYQSTLKTLQQKNPDLKKTGQKNQKQENGKLSDSLQRQYWALGYIAAGKLKNRSAQVSALEELLLTGKINADEDLMPVSHQLLWQTYQQYASEIGNKNHLLIGDDQAWFQLASNLLEKEPLKARSLMAYLSIQATEKNQRLVSMEQLALSIKQKLPQGMKLVELLFINNKTFASLDQIAERVRYLLLDFALSRGKIKQAAKLFGYLPEPPEGQQRLAWSLRRSRVLVLGGQYPQAAEVIKQIIEKETLDKENTNRLMQVVFDFQKVEQHQLALDLFKTLLEKIPSAEIQREFRFWMAESYHALKQYENAAHFYLTSALMIAEKQNDPWSQTARYRAADVLMQAGMIGDARSLYRQLLRTTKDPNRKAVIKQKMQQLWLMEGKQADVSN